MQLSRRGFYAATAFFSNGGKNDPDFGKAIEGVYSSAMGLGELDQKTKLLVALFLDVAHSATQGVVNIARQFGA
ncbi:MAG: hypothetical protein L5655_04700 [Thermosediminibacteraceae bacterium]|nr:hypothetical protein [Thermosediminibacteraceae bacterium]